MPPSSPLSFRKKLFRCLWSAAAVANLLLGFASAQDVSVGLVLEDGREFRANLKTVDLRAWARFESRTGGDMPTTDRIMGARLYSMQDNGAKLETLQLNNGTLDQDLLGNWYCKGVVRFTKLWVDVRSRKGEVGVWEDGFNGTRRYLYDGPSIPWPERKVVTTRFAISNEPSVGKKALTFETHNNWLPTAGTYGPGKLPVRLATTTEEDAKRTLYGQTLSAYAMGQPAPNARLIYPKAGPWMAPGYPSIMEPGGVDIECYPDPSGRFGTLEAIQMHMRWQDRSRDALYGPQGQQLTVDSFGSFVGYSQLSYADTVEPGALELPFFLTGNYTDGFHYRWYNGGPRAGDEAVWNFKGEVTSHSIRAFRKGVYAWAHVGDPSIREDLRAQFESRLFEYSDSASAPVTNPWDSSPGAWVPPSLTKLAYDTAKNPHAGSGVDRAFGHIINLGSVMQWLGYDRAAWLNKAVDTFEMIAMLDCGVVSSKTMDKPWIPQQYHGEQFFHNLLLYNGHFNATRVLGRPDTTIATFCAAHFDNPALPPQTYLYSPDPPIAPQVGPSWWIALYDGTHRIPVQLSTSWGNDESLPLKKGDIQFNLHILTLCYMATNDPRWLTVSLRYHVPHPTLQIRKTWLNGSGQGQDNNYVGLQREVFKLAVPSQP